MIMQLLAIATVFLFISSLATVAVPKLAGELIDVCIKFHAGGSEGKEAAKKHLNRKWLLLLHTGSQICMISIPNVASRCCTPDVNLQRAESVS